MKFSLKRRVSLLAIAATLAVVTGPALAQKKYGPGASDTEIKLGQTMPYSGPLSAFGTIGKAQAAYFEMINSKGGVNGRRVKLLSLDDGYSPPKTIEQTRKLVESDEVLLLFSSFGTPPRAHSAFCSPSASATKLSPPSTTWACSKPENASRK